MSVDTYAPYWHGEQTGALATFVSPPAYRQIFDHARPNLQTVADGAVACIREDLASGEANILPVIYCDFGTISTAKLYGGKVIPPPENGNLHIEPVVQVPEQLAGLAPCPFEESDFQLAVDLHRLVCDRLETDQVFVRTPDFQGPMNTLALVMDHEELMVGMYTEPGAIHAALSGITDTLIDYHRRLRRKLGGGKVIGNIWPFTFLPEDLGASITQDMMPLLSPDLYREFEIPHLRRIAEAFNGVQIHCCGRYGQHLTALRELGPLVRGLEFHHPFTPFAEIHAMFGDDIVYIPHLFGECNDYADYVAFARDLLQQGTGNTRYWFAQAKGWCNELELRNVVAAR